MNLAPMNEPRKPVRSVQRKGKGRDWRKPLSATCQCMTCRIDRRDAEEREALRKATQVSRADS